MTAGARSFDDSGENQIGVHAVGDVRGRDDGGIALCLFENRNVFSAAARREKTRDSFCGCGSWVVGDRSGIRTAHSGARNRRLSSPTNQASQSG